MFHQLIASEQQPFSQPNNQDANAAIKRKSLLAAASVHRS
ncbi:MAG: hypothetical protein QOF72_471 [Blastocatellia bacterium]|nr:hypothetical protein [Blastocatellia bacterium]MDX6574177.1 hypothetical protein [Blastocatellia bacterium]